MSKLCNGRGYRVMTTEQIYSNECMDRNGTYMQTDPSNVHHRLVVFAFTGVWREPIEILFFIPLFMAT